MLNYNNNAPVVPAAEEAVHEDCHQCAEASLSNAMEPEDVTTSSPAMLFHLTPNHSTSREKIHPATIFGSRPRAPAVTREPRSLSPQAPSRGKQPHKGGFVRVAGFPQRLRCPGCGPAPPALSRDLGSGSGCKRKAGSPHWRGGPSGKGA